MKRIVLSSIFLISSFYATAQDQKWSVEANYPLNITNDSGIGELNGIIDLGIKYRFIELGSIILGAGINTSYLKNNYDFTYATQDGDFVESDYKTKSFFIQPKIFAEILLPGIPRLRPQVATGYTVIVDDRNYKDNDIVVFDKTGTKGGLNLNLGLSYDITKRFFIQVQYDYLNISKKEDIIRNGQSSHYINQEFAGLLKAGVGLMF